MLLYVEGQIAAFARRIEIRRIAQPLQLNARVT